MKNRIREAFAVLLSVLMLLTGCTGASPQVEEGGVPEPVTWGDVSFETGGEWQIEPAGNSRPSAWKKICEEYTITEVHAVSEKQILVRSDGKNDQLLFLDAETGEILHILELDISGEPKVYVFSENIVVCDRKMAYVLDGDGTLLESILIKDEIPAEGTEVLPYCIDPENNLIYFSIVEEKSQESVLYVVDRETDEKKEILRLSCPEENRGDLNGFYELAVSTDGRRIYFTGYYFVEEDREGYPCYGYVETESGEAVVCHGEKEEMQVLRDGCLFYDGMNDHGEGVGGEITIFENAQADACSLSLEQPEESQWVVSGTESEYFYSILRDDTKQSTQIRQYDRESGEATRTYILPYYIQQAAFTGESVFFVYTKWDDTLAGWLWTLDSLRLDEAEENPFDLQAIEETGQEITAAYGFGLADGAGVDKGNQTIEYNGGEWKLRFVFDNQGGDCQIGLLIFVDGVAQSCHLEGEEETCMVVCDLNGIGKVYVDVYLTPEFGQAGGVHYLTFAGMLNPFYIPKTSESGYGNNHRTLPNLPYRMEYPAASAEIKAVEVKESESWTEEHSGIHAEYLQGGESVDSLEIINGETEFQIAITCKGLAEEQYRMSLWVNGSPVPAFVGMYYADISVGEGKRVTVDAQLKEEMAQWSELNSMDVVLVPLTNQDSAYGPLIENLRTITIVH